MFKRKLGSVAEDLKAHKVIEGMVPSAFERQRLGIEIMPYIEITEGICARSENPLEEDVSYRCARIHLNVSDAPNDSSCQASAK